MKTAYTQEEAAAFIHCMQEQFDMVRIVNPETRTVCALDSLLPTTEICHNLWDRCERCENCSSLRALKSKNVAYKIEFVKDKIFLIISRYMEIQDKPIVVEIVANATKDFITDSDQKDQLGKIIMHHNHLVITDELTGLYNRRFLREYFIPSLRCCHTEHITVNMAIFDIDKFKHVNDTYGHLAGDQLLRDVAGFWQLHFNSREKNKDKLVIRYGGDEILIVTCGMKKDKFESLVQRNYDEMRKICYYKDVKIPFSLSIGFASSEEFAQDWEWDTIFDLADKRLYAHKHDR